MDKNKVKLRHKITWVASKYKSLKEKKVKK